ncbi:GNAT family N-acetyltransferase [Kitasatospora sp. NBC_00240]|uniref:GNAT family N-acetyltransferase n=1 Tax=Kitasatospora sp. NBC_00240 TaxID=2903567 RepID=UPI00224DC863|nr:GNAT family N-acetyltransferase [Kitasatospora sp. NBC_00240]MCX5211554.1 GNAT family N-acetyltransferase [Kitasatospora sp. NBC_00240]
MRTLVAAAIRTDRLDLLPLEPADAEEMAVVLADPALHAFTGGEPDGPDALRARYRRLGAGSPDPDVSWCNWILRLRVDGRAVGYVQATGTLTAQSAEIAWVVGTPWQGRGLAGEAARALLAWLRTQGVRTVVAHIHPGHEASAAVARAAGLTPTAERQDGEVRWRAELSPERPAG